MKPCVFCEALAGRIAVSKVYENEDVLAFLDHKPLFPGHVLLIPKRHIVTLDELLPSELGPLFGELRVFVRSVPRALGAEGCFVANNNVVSQTVHHVHLHAIPRRKGDGLKGFFWPRVPYRDAEHQEQVRAAIETAHAQERILDFWFGPPQADGFALGAYVQRWFAADAQFDLEIRTGFGALLERALQGDLDHWAATPRGRLALIVLLDQFTRNLNRHRGAAFAGDARAQQLALEGVQLGLDRELSLDERVFFYMPFEHGEAAEWQKLSVEKIGELARAAPDAYKERFATFLDYAVRHARIIERFGRYPHRNEALGREGTPEEIAFLEEPDSSFW
jgi:uncharacterized protein (DUF924 family)/diadenosine tetraphosphate (Ap4A) HIT family hydrolase